MVSTQVASISQLPAEPDEFVGRAAELRDIDGLLRSGRLVTLTGTGGVGKTRVALRAARAAQPRYPDGARLVELSALRDPELLPHTIARQLGLAEQALASPRDALLARLPDLGLLLILDTCEHLIDACAELAEEILAGAPLVTVLATSREPLSVAGEVTFPVQPLPVSAPGEGGRNGDAVELFARRAATAAPGFAVTDANRADVTRICQELDGIPLAIEMAAGQLRDLSLAEILSRLDRRLTLLNRAGDAQAGRHASARNAIAWSYDTCTTQERSLWARLSVFPGGFDVSAATEVCASGELGGTAVFETIIRLVDKSLLVRVAPAGADSGEQPRFRMLDTIREFGAERLAASGEAAPVRNRLIERHLAMARYFEEHIFGDEQQALFRQLRREHANIRAALEYALGGEEGQVDRTRDGAELATRLWGYWVSAGLMSEGLHWLGRALDLCTEPGTHRMWALLISCYIGLVSGDAPLAVARGIPGVELAVSLKDRQGEARGWAFLCGAYTLSGHPAEGAAAGRKAEPLLTALDDTVGMIILAAHQCYTYQALGDLDQSIAWYQRALELVGSTVEWWFHGYVYVIASLAYFAYPGKDAECSRVLKLALLAKYELEEVLGTAYSLEILGWLAARSGRHERAAWLMGSAEPLWKRVGARLANSPAFEQPHREAEAATRGALGDQRYDALASAGARHPLDQVVALAINDADTLSDRVPATDRPGVLLLTHREQEVAILAAAGLSAGQIAGQLFITAPAVEEHLASVFAKLGVTSAAQLGPWLGVIAGPPASGADAPPHG